MIIRDIINYQNILEDKMDILKKIFPLSFVKDRTLGQLIINIIVYVIVGALAGIAIGILAGLPIIGILVGVCGGLIDLYVVIGIVLSILVYLKILN